MSFVHIGALALVQGITEFLPVSSSGHLVLVPIITGWPDQGLIIDVAVHVGTLGAVMLYFWRDIGRMILGIVSLGKERNGNGARLAGYLIVATVPVAVAGLAVNYYLADALRSLTVIAWATLIFGLVLYVADRRGMTVRRVEHMTLFDALIVGLAQALSLIPGTSRSGITMSAARMLGLERAEAARFSMLLSIPAILGAGALKTRDLYAAGDIQLSLDAALAAGLAFVTALIAIAVLMAWLKRATFTPFVVYRVLLGGVLLALAYGT
ncbi:MAG: undecaprenyl-diphosphate phosphatase [Rhodospirillales bacterium]|jgi:undecaprenyl-diphosphatase|nr:undecaprenyl-diphosphate phosphatase [Rhodospirillales bacterium]